MRCVLGRTVLKSCSGWHNVVQLSQGREKKICLLARRHTWQTAEIWNRACRNTNSSISASTEPILHAQLQVYSDWKVYMVYSD